MTFCPCCGQSWTPPNITVDLDRNTAMVHGRPVRLETMEADMLFAILRKMPRSIRREALAAAVYGQGEWPATWRQCLSVRMATLRRKLRSEGYSIPHVPDRGYRVEPCLAGERVAASAV